VTAVTLSALSALADGSHGGHGGHGGHSPGGPSPGGGHADVGTLVGWVGPGLALAGLAAYCVGVAVLNRRGDRWPVARTAAAVGAGAMLAVASAPPFAASGDFRVHAGAHVLLAMLGPLLLALSCPVTLALRTMPRRGRRVTVGTMHRRAVRLWLSGPVIVALDVCGMYLFYLTGLFQAAHDRPWLHAAVHAHMVLAGFLLAWYVVGRDPVPGRRSTASAAAALLAAAVAHDILAKTMYARELPTGAGEHLQAGAQLMYYGGHAVEIALAAALLAGWYAKTGRELARERRRASPTAATPAMISTESGPGRRFRRDHRDGRAPLAAQTR
jgi:putative membrane protein